MKEVFLVKKDVTKPNSQDNWLIMNKTQFARFKETEASKGRKFRRLSCADDKGRVLTIECEPKMARELDRDLHRIQRNYKAKKELGIEVLSYSATLIGGDICEEVLSIPDETADVEEIVNRKMMVERLRVALTHLSDSERYLIDALFLSKERKTMEQVAAELGVSVSTIFERKTAILKKLQTFFQI